jgi:hypothetical protein
MQLQNILNDENLMGIISANIKEEEEIKLRKKSESEVNINIINNISIS